ncbi:hypothetical protein LWC34_31800 [Kibdelosporangium philippinense]|uniref:Uncharacterized protein n=1 Tax=Kibdelosporangium philippinense TaxID=211113 RepID=A0ABS8ZII1_9PSEU|nr:hypothetical protein [Kibdelosporangium philippinense]MCE7007367.1 hypothetical protein [Kibdelosporangium philippinense]
MIGLEEDAVAASETVVDEGFARWQAGFDDMFALVAGRFAQADSRARAQKYLLGLLSGVERKNSWSLAELAGESSPDGMQHHPDHHIARVLSTRLVTLMNNAQRPFVLPVQGALFG